MKSGFLLDTNTVIDYFNDRLPLAINEIIESTTPNFSVITRIELLAWPRATIEQIQITQSFINNARILGMEESVILEAIQVRKKYKIKLPDAIIASTAIVNNLAIITNNVSDFSNIKKLEVINSFK